MPVFHLPDRVVFPDPALAEPGGLLAVGGDLSPERLLAAYGEGIFPWYSEGDPILWWAPDPRTVLFPGELHVPRSLRKARRRRPYELSMDRAFGRVIRACASVARPGQDGTWITEDMIRAYVRLHELGHAHSVEAWADGDLVGGLYGVAVGGVFFGESMFALRPDASKIAFVSFVEQFARWGGALIDCQLATEHLARFGARPIALSAFRDQIQAEQATRLPTTPWTFDADEVG